MTAIIIKAILIIIAAVCSAAMDTVFFHPRTSKLTGKFWDIHNKAKNLPLTKWPFSGWHVCKTICVGSLMAIGFVDYFYIYQWYYVIGAYVLTGGLLWILPFNLFYNKILVKK